MSTGTGRLEDPPVELSKVPTIRADVYLRQEPEGAAVVNANLNDYFLASPVEAFLLSLCDGTRSLRDIISLLGNLRNHPGEDKIVDDTRTLLAMWQDFVELVDEPLPASRTGLDPYTFLSRSSSATRPERPYAPLSVDLYLTRRCNLNCVYCFADATYERAGQESASPAEMDFRMVAHIIDQMADLHIKKVLLTGGEVTLRPDLPDIARYATDRDIGVTLASNAALIDGTLARRLRDSGVGRVQAKLDAFNPATHDRLSRARDVRRQLSRGIETLLESGFSVSVVCVVTAWNIREAPEVIADCVRLGVREVSPRIYTPGIWALKSRGGAFLNPAMSDVNWLEGRIAELQREFRDVARIASLDLSAQRKVAEDRVPTCSGLTSSCTILENGLISPCENLADFSRDFIIGDARQHDLVTIWNSESAEKWRKQTIYATGEPCTDCGEFAKCRGGCPWRSLVSYGRRTCDPVCVRAPEPTHISFAAAWGP
jgi:radical SAM protein with 4Fe4S-binding SPASM domain